MIGQASPILIIKRSLVGEDRAGQAALMIICVEHQGIAQLAQVGDADGTMRLRPYARYSGQEDGSQDCDNSDYHEQLDDGQTAPGHSYPRQKGAIPLIGGYLG